MSTLGPTDLPEINAAIQEGRGAAASVLGQTYDVRRLDGATNGSVSNNAPVLSSFQARPRRTTSRKAIENSVFDLLVFEMLCDNRDLAVGDLCTQTGYGNDGSVFYVAQFRPTRETLWVRAEGAANITRPIPTAGSAGQQPMSGWVAGAPGAYSGISKDNEEVLTLVNGAYAFTTAPGASPAVVYAGLQPRVGIREASEPKIPGVGPLGTLLYKEHFLVYLPLLPGEEVSELDRVAFPSLGDRYEVALVFTTESTGFAGYVCVCQKLPN